MSSNSQLPTTLLKGKSVLYQGPHKDKVYESKPDQKQAINKKRDNSINAIDRRKKKTFLR